MEAFSALSAWFADPRTWTGLMQIILADLLLSGDNALVIALACHSLPAHQQKRAIILGGGAAIALRVVLTISALFLLRLPYLKLVGGLLLLWIAVKLLLPEQEEEGAHITGSGNMWGAIKTIVIADFVMSVDNVLAVAGAAHGDVALLTIGLLLSIPLIIYGSTLILRLIERFPVIVLLGAGMLGYIGGEMIVGDVRVAAWVEANLPLLHTVAPVVCALAVVVMGKLFAPGLTAAAPVVDLARPGPDGNGKGE